VHLAPASIVGVLGLYSDSEHPAVELVADDDGLRLLEQALAHLRRGETHVHFMTPDWAGTELDALDEKPGSVLVHMFTLRRAERSPSGRC
jgi:hypothetical protein